VTLAPLQGLVLAGGESRRMGTDKAALEIAGRSALARAVALVEACCTPVFVSVRAAGNDPLRAKFATIADRHGGIGPADGIASAQANTPDAAWLVVACDLPRLDTHTLSTLLAARDGIHDAVAYRSETSPEMPEPLCAIYEPGSREQVERMLASGLRCPRKMLLAMNTLLLSQPVPQALQNVNTPDDLALYRAAGTGE
jgi:molybdopterin-guanine dinucleotide biosynthesis protein A